MPINVTVWHEYRHEKEDAQIAKIYPQGIHGAIASHLRKAPDLKVRTATLDEPEHGLTESVLKSTDVLTWWGHMAHDDVQDAIVERVYQRVLGGMGLLVMHSGHFSKIFRKLMGTTCNLKWRDDGEQETLWISRPGHPIVAGLDDYFILPHEEMYGEFFDVPEPECTFLISSFTGGEVFRSGCTWTRGNGKVVYFRPGHEMFPTFFDKSVLRVIENAVRWAAPAAASATPTYGHREMGWFGGKTGK